MPPSASDVGCCRRGILPSWRCATVAIPNVADWCTAAGIEDRVRVSGWSTGDCFWLMNRFRNFRLMNWCYVISCSSAGWEPDGIRCPGGRAWRKLMQTVSIVLMSWSTLTLWCKTRPCWPTGGWTTRGRVLLQRFLEDVRLDGRVRVVVGFVRIWGQSTITRIKLLNDTWRINGLEDRGTRCSTYICRPTSRPGRILLFRHLCNHCVP